MARGAISSLVGTDLSSSKNGKRTYLVALLCRLERLEDLDELILGRSVGHGELFCAPPRGWEGVKPCGNQLLKKVIGWWRANKNRVDSNG